MGAISYDELISLWSTAVDPDYGRTFLEDKEGTLFEESYGQLIAQLEATSKAVDITTQAFFIRPWSGQSNPSARGPARAQVEVSITRTLNVNLPMILGKTVIFAEEQYDSGESGPEPFLTGRVFNLLEEVVFNPGEMGPITAIVEASKSGYGYNHPIAGSIRVIPQPGFNLSNIKASATSSHVLSAQNHPDTPIPEHVDQYVKIISGTNQGGVFRIFNYGDPVPANNVGGIFFFDHIASAEVDALGAQFQNGEVVSLQDVTVPSNPIILSQGYVLKQSSSDPHTFITWRVTDGIVKAGPNIILMSASSGLFANVSKLLMPYGLVSSSDNTWAMMDWKEDWGISVFNPLSPTGGRSGMLDALGRERNINRSSGETDEIYAERVTRLADLITPGAIRRAINRIMGVYGLGGCFREVGSDLLPGFFLDNDAFDYDFTARPANRFRTMFSYENFRAGFLVGVPDIDWGEFGFAYDGGVSNAYDCTTALAFYDGFPIKASRIFKTLFNELNSVKAGGVWFDLYEERIGCF